MQVEKITSRIGARVGAIDLTRPLAPTDVAAIRAYERARWEHGVQMAEGVHIPVGVAVDGDAALAASAPGEGGWVTTVFRHRETAWVPIAYKAYAPTHCLFQRAGIDSVRERRLTARLIATAPVIHSYPYDRVMHADQVSTRRPCEALAQGITP